MASDLTVEKDLHHHHDEENEHDQELWQGGEEPFKAGYGKLMMWYFLVSDAFTFAGFLIAYGTLRFSMPTWPVPDFVFQAFPGGFHHSPLIFVTLMTFILIVSSVTMVRGVQEGHRGNKDGVVFWMLLTIVGGAAFLGCQAWEWTTLIQGENVSITRNPFGRHEFAGTYTQNEEGEDYKAGQQAETFKQGQGYLLEPVKNEETKEIEYTEAGKMKFIQRKFIAEDGQKGELKEGPFQFGALFFFITGFHGFHVLSGVVFLAIIMLNAASGLYHRRGNHYEMVEKIGLYWHFVDLVWVFVFLVFYLL